jgi:tetratricopeptide (TPR) repeat protein
VTPRRQAFVPASADWLQAAMVSAALFILYSCTAPRTVALEDDGLFVLASYYLGIAHPPGYPIYTALGKLFTLLPFGSVAYRVHLLSALFGGLTCAMLWLCARLLFEGRMPAYLAALGLGASPVFWSQSIIAEVYTLKTFFFLVLVFLGLRACPPSPSAETLAQTRRVLPWMAFVFGLSLANHWPLMLLVAPAFAVLLWPRRQEILRRTPLLATLAALGLFPYVWMVILSWMWLPISFDGPLHSLAEIWYFVSRAGYAETDTSASASWLDRAKFFQFLGGQLLLQFAVLGTLLAAFGVAMQKRVLGTRLAIFLTVAFLMPSAVLLLLLGFDYDSASKHVFHVYPLPAYAVVALWMGLGLDWLRQRYQLRRGPALAACVAVLGLVLAGGGWFNLRTDSDWGIRYAQTILRILPTEAVLFLRGDADLAPIAYLYLVEGWRPDIEIYHSRGLVLGNRLFHPLQTSEEEVQRKLRQFIDEKHVPIGFTMEHYGGYARRDRWLYIEIDKSSTDGKKVTVDIPEEALRFFEESIAQTREPNAWIAFHQQELRRRYGTLLGRRLQRDEALDARSARHLAILRDDFYGALGLAEGLMANREVYAAGAVADLLERAKDLMPSDVAKAYRSSFFYLRGALRLDLGDKPGALGDFETALYVWPVSDSRAIEPLKDLYRAGGNEQALKALESRVVAKKR